jgi:hypothetical protein
LILAKQTGTVRDGQVNKLLIIGVATTQGRS